MLNCIALHWIFGELIKARKKVDLISFILQSIRRLLKCFILDHEMLNFSDAQLQYFCVVEQAKQMPNCTRQLYPVSFMIFYFRRNFAITITKLFPLWSTANEKKTTHTHTHRMFFFRSLKIRLELTVNFKRNTFDASLKCDFKRNR